MDSNNELEQPVVDSGASVEQPSTPDTHTLSDGTEVSIDELKSWYLRQSDYTKKTQALAKEKETPKNPELDETKKILQDMGFATVEELTDLKKFRDDSITEKQNQATQNEFNEFAGQYKTLWDSQKTILRDLKKVYPDKSYDDILQSTWFIDQAMLDKSKWGGIKGDSLGIPQPKEELKINKNVARKHNLKSAGELADLKSQFNL